MVIARVISQQGSCSAGHRVGDEFVLGEVSPPGLCTWALYTLFPFAEALQFGGSLPWESDPDVSVIACPDAKNPVVFEMRRIRK